MCAVSMVTDYYREKIWPQPWTSPTFPPYAPMVPDDYDWHMTISRKDWEHYQELKRCMEEYDRKTGQPDCVKPEVAEWERIVEGVLIKKGLIHINY
jgi:hypothetical protein